MDLVISAVEDVIVDTIEDQKYIEYKRENVKAEEILRLVSNRVSGDFSKVDKIYLNMGPGSFTGIRASMALVLGLTAGKNNKVIPFTSFDALEYDKLTAKQILAVSGFSNFVYISYLEGKTEKNDCVEIEKMVEIALKNDMTILSYNEKILEQADSKGAKTMRVKFSPEYVVKKHKEGKLQNRAFEPVYLRLSQAELQRKENKK